MTLESLSLRPARGLLVALALSACNSKTATPPPAAPSGVAALAGDGSVTVNWESSAGATGYRVYYNVESAGPVTTSSQAIDAGTDLFVVVGGLVDGTEYRFAVAARGLGGEGPLSSEVTATPQTNAPIAVSSTTPADGATGVSRTTAIAVTFNRPATASSLTGQTSAGACSGSLQLSSDGFTTCAAFAGAPVASSGNVTFTLALAAPLAASATYLLRVTTALLDAEGFALAQTFTQAQGFTTTDAAAALAVASTQPGNGALDVPLNVNLQVTFNQAVTASSVTLTPSGSTVCGSIGLQAGGASAPCIPLSLVSVSSDGQTFTLAPLSLLASSTSYSLSVTSAVLDATGAPLANPYSSTFTTGSATDTTPPAEISGVTVTPQLQSISLLWSNPSDADFSLVRVHLCSPATAGATCDLSGANSVVAQIPGAPSAQANTLLSSLIPYTAYNLRITTVDQSGNESAGTLESSTTVFSGSALDFTAAQQVASVGLGTAGGTISTWLTWNASNLYVAMGNSAGTSLLTANQDVLWIAVDTDPGVDQTGEPRTPSLGNNEVIWPFQADYIVELIPNGTNSTVVVRPAGGCALIQQPTGSTVASACPAAAGALGFDGTFANGPAEVAIPSAALGNPSQVRLAFAALNSTNGYAYAIAPQNPGAIDVTGYFGSSTASLYPGTNLWNLTAASSAASSTVSPLSPAAALVTLSVQSQVQPTLKGSLHPLSYTLTDTSYSLRDDGTGGDATAGDGVWSGAFNFGAVSQQLFFKYGQNGSDEFAAGSDRVWTLAGAAESLPQLVYATAYSATHTFQLTFQVSNPGGTSADKEVLGNVAELGNFTAGSGAVLTSSSDGTWTTPAVPFSNHDFTLTPLQWKAHDNGSNTWESDWPGGPVANHEMNDDVLNRRTLSWTWDDYSNDPF